MSIDDQTGYLRTYNLLELSLDILQVQYHANNSSPLPSQRLYQIAQSSVDMYSPWIHEVIFMYISIGLIQVETGSVRPVNVFTVLNSVQ